MADRSFPEVVPALWLIPPPVELVVPRQPLLPIFQTLGISIHDVVNDSRQRWAVRDLYRITRRIQNEGWLRRQFERAQYEAWIAAHL